VTADLIADRRECRRRRRRSRRDSVSRAPSGAPGKGEGDDNTRPSISRAPSRVACGEGEQAWVRKHWTDTAPPYGCEKEGTSWWEATALVPLGETVITTIRLSPTCRRSYAAEAALDGISLLTVQIYGSTTSQFYKFMFSDTLQLSRFTVPLYYVAIRLCLLARDQGRDRRHGVGARASLRRVRAPGDVCARAAGPAPVPRPEPDRGRRWRILVGRVAPGVDLTLFLGPLL